MLKVLGTDYLFQHIETTYKKEQEQLTYQIYVTNALQAISENTAGFSSNGKYISTRWWDILHPKPADTRTATDIINHIRAKLAGTAQ